MNKTYSLRNTRIGNSNGFRLPAEFYRDNPQFADADGWINTRNYLLGFKHLKLI